MNCGACEGSSLHVSVGALLVAEEGAPTLPCVEAAGRAKRQERQLTYTTRLS